jgi:hypothetical protein
MCWEYLILVNFKSLAWYLKVLTEIITVMTDERVFNSAPTECRDDTTEKDLNLIGAGKFVALK